MTKAKKSTLQEQETVEQTMFALLKLSLWGSPCSIDALEDPAAVYKEMRAQAVAGLPNPWLIQLQDTTEAIQQWKTDHMRRIAFFLQLIYSQDSLVTLLQGKGFHPVILKGCAAAAFYPQPELRAMGDIDLLVPPEEFDACLQTMLEHGYTGSKEERFKGYHVNLYKDGIEFELHHKPAGIGENERGAYFMKIIEKGFANIETKEVSAYPVPMLPPLQNGIILLLHIEKHLKEGLGLRQIIDWMLFANRQLRDDFWKTECEPVFSAAGLETLAVTVTRMCQLYLGLPTEHITWCAGADESLCHALMAYILEQGNFGRKKGAAERGAGVLTRNGIGIQAVKSLQYNGEQNWKLLKTHPNLRCFAWAYQIFHYISGAFSREKPIRRAIQDFKVARQRKRLLKKLGGFQTKVKR